MKTKGFGTAVCLILHLIGGYQASARGDTGQWKKLEAEASDGMEAQGQRFAILFSCCRIVPTKKFSIWQLTSTRKGTSGDAMGCEVYSERMMTMYLYRIELVRE